MSAGHTKGHARLFPICKKLHVGVDGSGVIVAQVLTDGHVDDATKGVNRIEAVAKRRRKSFLGTPER